MVQLISVILIYVLLMLNVQLEPASMVNVQAVCPVVQLICVILIYVLLILNVPQEPVSTELVPLAHLQAVVLNAMEQLALMMQIVLLEHASMGYVQAVRFLVQLICVIQLLVLLMLNVPQEPVSMESVLLA